MKRGYFLILGLMIFFASCSDSNETRMQRFLIQGNEKIREQEYEQAEKYFHSALKLDSCFADALNNLGFVEQRRQNIPGSITYYSRAIECSDTFFLAYINRANVYFESGQFEKALVDATRAGQLRPDTSIVEELKGLAYWKMNEPAKALSSFRTILAKRSTHLNSLINAGTLYTRIRNYDSAVYFLEKARAVNEADPRISNAMAMLYSARGDHQRALSFVEEALGADKEDPFFLNNKGFILLMLDRDDEARELIDRSIVGDPYNGWAYRNKGIYFFRKGDYEEALRLINRAEEMDPSIDDIFHWKGLALLKNNISDGCRYLSLAVDAGQISEARRKELCP